MKEIIPIKKDIVFKTLIGEITSINLDLDYKIKEDLIDGNVILEGSYKMTEASVLEDDFYYKIPFGVSITKKLNKDSLKVEIDDFKYETSKDILSVSVDLELTYDEEIEDLNEYFNDEENIELEDELNIENTSINEEINNIDIEENVNNINNYINCDNKYYTYKVYIVRKNDTIESICNKYNVSINDLKDYNNINEINVGDKIIIPYLND